MNLVSKKIPIRFSRLLLALVVTLLLIVLLATTTNVEAQSGCRAYHTVGRGETLFRIALRYGTTWPILAQANGITNPDRIYAGQVLCIPYGGTGGIPPVATVVNCYYLNVRNGPGVGYTVVEIVSRGTQVHLLGRNSAGTWIQIRTPAGHVGWVNGFYLSGYVPIGQLPVVGSLPIDYPVAAVMPAIN